MSFGDALKTGVIWGCWVGGFLGIVTDLVWVFGESATETLEITTVVLPVIGILLFCIICCVALGGLIALAILGLIGSFQLLNWVFIVLSGSILSISGILATFSSIVLGWASITLIPILLILHKYLKDKAPEWLEKSLDQTIITIVSGFIITLFLRFFESRTGITVRGV